MKKLVFTLFTIVAVLYSCDKYPESEGFLDEVPGTAVAESQLGKSSIAIDAIMGDWYYLDAIYNCVEEDGHVRYLKGSGEYDHTAYLSGTGCTCWKIEKDSLVKYGNYFDSKLHIYRYAYSYDTTTNTIQTKADSFWDLIRSDWGKLLYADSEMLIVETDNFVHGEVGEGAEFSRSVYRKFSLFDKYFNRVFNDTIYTEY